jgi:hypothetical protein
MKQMKNQLRDKQLRQLHQDKTNIWQGAARLLSSSLKEEWKELKIKRELNSKVETMMKTMMTNF